MNKLFVMSCAGVVGYMWAWKMNEKKCQPLAWEVKLVRRISCCFYSTVALYRYFVNRFSDRKREKESEKRREREGEKKIKENRRVEI